MATLEDVLVPLYMGHRYQVEAVAKVDWRRGLYVSACVAKAIAIRRSFRRKSSGVRLMRCWIL